MRVIKVGGHELDEKTFLPRLCQAVKELGEAVVVVHGGGQAIGKLQNDLRLEPKKIDGLRVTDGPSLAVAEMVLSGQVNKHIVRAFLAAGLDALGVSGIDGACLRCRPKCHDTVDLGFVGQVTSVRADLFRLFGDAGFSVVLSPISLGPDGQAFNVNADEAAAAVGGALGTAFLDFISNVPGVMVDGQVVPRLSFAESEDLIAQGIIRDGMVPKVRAAWSALGSGVAQARIVDLKGLSAGGGTTMVTSAGPTEGR